MSNLFTSKRRFKAVLGNGPRLWIRIGLNYLLAFLLTFQGSLGFSITSNPKPNQNGNSKRTQRSATNSNANNSLGSNSDIGLNVMSTSKIMGQFTSYLMSENSESGKNQRNFFLESIKNDPTKINDVDLVNRALNKVVFDALVLSFKEELLQPEWNSEFFKISPNKLNSKSNTQSSNGQNSNFAYDETFKLRMLMIEIWTKKYSAISASAQIKAEREIQNWSKEVNPKDPKTIYNRVNSFILKRIKSLSSINIAQFSRISNETVLDLAVKERIRDLQAKSQPNEKIIKKYDPMAPMTGMGKLVLPYYEHGGTGESPAYTANRAMLDIVERATENVIFDLVKKDKNFDQKILSHIKSLESEIGGLSQGDAWLNVFMDSFFRNLTQETYGELVSKLHSLIETETHSVLNDWAKTVTSSGKVKMSAQDFTNLYGGALDQVLVDLKSRLAMGIPDPQVKSILERYIKNRTTDLNEIFHKQLSTYDKNQNKKNQEKSVVKGTTFTSIVESPVRGEKFLPIEIEIPDTPLEELIAQSPGSLRIKQMGGFVKNVAIQKVLFDTAMFAVTLMQVGLDSAAHPLAISDFYNSLKDPVSWISFGAFMVGNHEFAKLWSKILPNPKLHRLGGYLGMVMGMTLSNTLSSFMHDPNIDKCSKSYLKDLNACQSAYNSWVLTTKINELAPSAIGLLGTAITSTIITEGVKAAAVWSYPAVSKVFNGAKSIVDKPMKKVRLAGERISSNKLVSGVRQRVKIRLGSMKIIDRKKTGLEDVEKYLKTMMKAKQMVNSTLVTIGSNLIFLAVDPFISPQIEHSWKQNSLTHSNLANKLELGVLGTLENYGRMIWFDRVKLPHEMDWDTIKSVQGSLIQSRDYFVKNDFHSRDPMSCFPNRAKPNVKIESEIGINTSQLVFSDSDTQGCYNFNIPGKAMAVKTAIQKIDNQEAKDLAHKKSLDLSVRPDSKDQHSKEIPDDETRMKKSLLVQVNDRSYYVPLQYTDRRDGKDVGSFSRQKSNLDMQLAQMKMAELKQEEMAKQMASAKKNEEEQSKNNESVSDSTHGATLTREKVDTPLEGVQTQDASALSKDKIPSKENSEESKSEVKETINPVYSALNRRMDQFMPVPKFPESSDILGEEKVLWFDKDNPLFPRVSVVGSHVEVKVCLDRHEGRELLEVSTPTGGFSWSQLLQSPSTLGIEKNPDFENFKSCLQSSDLPFWIDRYAELQKGYREHLIEPTASAAKQWMSKISDFLNMHIATRVLYKYVTNEIHKYNTIEAVIMRSAGSEVEKRQKIALEREKLLYKKFRRDRLLYLVHKATGIAATTGIVFQPDETDTDPEHDAVSSEPQLTEDQMTADLHEDDKNEGSENTGIEASQEAKKNDESSIGSIIIPGRTDLEFENLKELYPENIGPYYTVELSDYLVASMVCGPKAEEAPTKWQWISSFYWAPWTQISDVDGALSDLFGYEKGIFSSIKVSKPFTQVVDMAPGMKFNFVPPRLTEKAEVCERTQSALLSGDDWLYKDIWINPGKERISRVNRETRESRYPWASRLEKTSEFLEEWYGKAKGFITGNKEDKIQKPYIAENERTAQDSTEYVDKAHSIYWQPVRTEVLDSNSRASIRGLVHRDYLNLLDYLIDNIRPDIVQFGQGQSYVDAWFEKNIEEKLFKDDSSLWKNIETNWKVLLEQHFYPSLTSQEFGDRYDFKVTPDKAYNVFLSLGNPIQNQKSLFDLWDRHTFECKTGGYSCLNDSDIYVEPLGVINTIIVEYQTYRQILRKILWELNEKVKKNGLPTVESEKAIVKFDNSFSELIFSLSNIQNDYNRLDITKVQSQLSKISMEFLSLIRGFSDFEILNKDSFSSVIDTQGRILAAMSKVLTDIDAYKTYIEVLENKEKNNAFDKNLNVPKSRNPMVR